MHQLVGHNNIYQILWRKKLKFSEPRTISGFLAQVGAEEAMTADQVIWSEQGRLHLSYKGTVAPTGDTNGTFTIVSDIDGNIAADWLHACKSRC
jgi:hypothetical protein